MWKNEACPEVGTEDTMRSGIVWCIEQNLGSEWRKLSTGFPHFLPKPYKATSGLYKCMCDKCVAHCQCSINTSSCPSVTLRSLPFDSHWLFHSHGELGTLIPFTFSPNVLTLSFSNLKLKCQQAALAWQSCWGEARHSLRLGTVVLVHSLVGCSSSWHVWLGELLLHHRH
jgi:hypothetical protein